MLGEFIGSYVLKEWRGKNEHWVTFCLILRPHHNKKRIVWLSLGIDEETTYKNIKIEIYRD